MTILTEIDHDRCRRSRHRTAADPGNGELGDHTGRMICGHCRQPLLYCSNAAERNRRHHGYERTYRHVNHQHEETCR